jgi:hypothetical protein
MVKFWYFTSSTKIHLQMLHNYLIFSHFGKSDKFGKKINPTLLGWYQSKGHIGKAVERVST